MLVTDRFTEYLRSLYLNEYPCHHRPTKERISKSALKKREISSINDLYEVEELLDLLKDIKSPWYEVIDWTKDGDYIRQTYVKNQSKINVKEIEKYFTVLRLNDLKIEKIDRKLRNFINLKELVLNCNSIKECDSSYLPESIEIFDMTGNYLKDLSKLVKQPMRDLQHFGLGFNWIENLNGYFDTIYWPSIRSLDLQYNQLDDLIGLIQDLSTLSKLKVLTLLGNPIVLLPGYRGLVIDNFPNLIALDDRVITREERIHSLDFNLYSDCINKEAEIHMTFLQIRNLILPEINEIEDAQPEIWLYKYLIQFDSIDDNNDPLIDEEFKDFNQHKLHSMAYSNKEWNQNHTYKIKTMTTEELDPAEHISFNEKGIIKLKLKALRQLRDFILDGVHMEIIERKRYYQSKDFVPSEAVADNTSKKNKKDKKDDKKDDKKSKNKKGNVTQLLDNYNLMSTEDRVVASFDLNTISAILDGSTKEITKNFSHKIKVEPKLEPPGTAMTGNKGRRTNASNNNSNRKSASIKGASIKGEPNKKPETVDAETIEPLPLELDVKFGILDFHEFKDLKSYFDEN